MPFPHLQNTNTTLQPQLQPRGPLLRLKWWCFLCSSFLLGGAGTLHTAGCIHDPPTNDDTGPTDDDPEGQSRFLTIPGGLELCSVSHTRFSPYFEDSSLFQFRSMVRIAEGPGPNGNHMIPLPDHDVQKDVDFVPFSVILDETGHTLDVQGSSSSNTKFDTVPHAIYPSAEAQGYDMATLTSTISTPPFHDRILEIKLASFSETTHFDLAPVHELNGQMRVWLSWAVPPLTPEGQALKALFAPCPILPGSPDERDRLDRLDFVFSNEDGHASFYTTPAIWDSLHGFTLASEGVIGDTSFNIDGHWDLEYSIGDIGIGAYHRKPFLAVRFAKTGAGPCILVVEDDLNSFEQIPIYKARLLRCDRTLDRELTVESFTFTPGALD